MLQNEEMEIDLMRLAKALLHRVWAIVLAALLCGAVGFGYARYFVTPLYSATAKMYVNNASDSAIRNEYITSADLTASQNLVNTYIAILQTADTMEAVVERAGVSYSYQELMKMVSANAVNNTEVFSVTVTAPDPQEAQHIANTITQVLPDRIAEVVEGSSVRIVQKALLPESPSSPNVLRNAGLGAVIGVVLSCGVIVLLEMFDRVIREEDYATKTYGLRTLAAIPDLMEDTGSSVYDTRTRHGKKKKRTVRKRRGKGYSLRDEQSVLCNKLNFIGSEAYKMLRSSLVAVLDGTKGGAVIGITSATSGEGKSTLAVNLAYTLALTDQSVLLIEGDLRKPVIAKRLRRNPVPGLTDYLTDQGEVLLQDSGYLENWKVLCAGSVQPNPSEQLGSPAMKALISELRAQFDYILIDLPPINEVTDAQVASEYLDGLILVVRQNDTTKAALDLAMEHLSFSQAELLGFVVTNASAGGKYGGYGKYGKYGKYKYGYGYGYQMPQSHTEQKAGER